MLLRPLLGLQETFSLFHQEITNKSYLSRNVEKESDFRIDLSIRACSLSM